MSIHPWCIRRSIKSRRCPAQCGPQLPAIIPRLIRLRGTMDPCCCWCHHFQCHHSGRCLHAHHPPAHQCHHRLCHQRHFLHRTSRHHHSLRCQETTSLVVRHATTWGATVVLTLLKQEMWQVRWWTAVAPRGQSQNSRSLSKAARHIHFPAVVPCCSGAMKIGWLGQASSFGLQHLSYLMVCLIMFWVDGGHRRSNRSVMRLNEL